MKKRIITVLVLVMMMKSMAAAQQSTPVADEAIREAMLAETAEQREKILSEVKGEKSWSLTAVLEFFRDYGFMPKDNVTVILNPIKEMYQVEVKLPNGKKRKRFNSAFLHECDNFDPNPMIGNYEGSGLNAQVIQMPADTFFIQLVEEFAWKGEQNIIATGVFEGDKGRGKGKDWQAKLGGGKLTLKDSNGKSYDLKHIVMSNPTMGKEPTRGAEILISKDGKNIGLTTQWETVDNALEIANVGGSTSIKSFNKPINIHLEFRLPNSSYAYNQQRGNSGLYLGKYEIQINDNFGFNIDMGHCGGLYFYTAPNCNASRPPAEWQTYDVEFSPEVWDEAGEKMKKMARVTIVHNGIKIIDDYELKPRKPKGKGKKKPAKPKKPQDPKLMLQNHHNKLQFRNFWFAVKK